MSLRHIAVLPKQHLFLVGGLGSRLGPLVKETPKPLLQVAGRPFLDHLIDRSRAMGAKSILLLAGHMGQHFINAYHSCADITVIVEPSPQGTGGALKQAENMLDEEFLLFNGDTFFTFDPALLAWLAENGEMDALMLLRSMTTTSRSGVVTLKNRRVVAFRERGNGGPGLINAGVYRLRRRALELLPEGRSSLEVDLLPALAHGNRLLGMVSEGVFIDIGIPEDYRRASNIIQGCQT